RWTFPDRADIASARLADLKSQMAPFADAPLEVVIVGDITPEKAIEAVRLTFGALPARTIAADPPAAPARFPAPLAQPVVLDHAGRADQAIAVEAWPTDGFFADPQRARETIIMGEVFELRMLDVLRKAESVTYSPRIGYDASVVWPRWGYLSATVEAPPAAIPGVMGDIDKIATDLRATDVSADELERAKKPKIEAAEKARQTNEYWLSALSGAQTDPRRLAIIRSELSGLERVTATDVREVAQRYLRDAAAWKLEIEPAPAAKGA
ncbi:MAG: M16 family metallopeptidase, partial [Caulobacteraceae bacterium]